MSSESKPEKISTAEALDRADLRPDDLPARATVPACCECGAMVEPDGECVHGRPSVLLAMGLV